MSNDDREKDSMWGIFVARYAMPMLTACIGFGTSQLLTVQALSSKVQAHGMELNRIDRDLIKEEATRNQDDLETRQRIAELRTQVEERFKNVVVLMESSQHAQAEIMRQNSEVIGLFRIQQQAKP